MEEIKTHGIVICICGSVESAQEIALAMNTVYDEMEKTLAKRKFLPVDSEGKFFVLEVTPASLP